MYQLTIVNEVWYNKQKAESSNYKYFINYSKMVKFSMNSILTKII